jgi:PAS domain S-box-containing protein
MSTSRAPGVIMETLVAVEADRAIGAASGSLDAYLEAALDCVIMADASGRIVEFNPAAERTFAYTRAEALGRTMAELIVPPSLRERHTRAFARFAETREPRLFGRRLELTGMRADGSEFPVELALSRVESEPLLICGALRDLSETKQTEIDLRKLAEEHAALHRVATLVAEQASPTHVFAAVAEEVRTVLGAPLVELSRFEHDGSMTVIGTAGEHPFRTGTRWQLDGPTASLLVRETGRPARVEYAELPGAIAQAARTAGIVSALGVPITVDGAVWGVMGVGATTDARLPEDIEMRLTAFTDLVATAIWNMQARDDLRRLVDEQAALRRIATLVAEGASHADVFGAVAREVAGVLDLELVELARYDPDGFATVLGAFGEHAFQVGTRWPLDGGSLTARVWRGGQPERIDDYRNIAGVTAQAAFESGVRAGVAVPIVVDGSTWGVIAAGSRGEPVPVGAEDRLTHFTELVATAVLNTQAREDLQVLVAEQASLGQVATLVALETPPEELFAAVAEEVGRFVDVPVIGIARYEADGTATAMGVWGPIPFPAGMSLAPHPGAIADVRRTGQPTHVPSYAELGDDVSRQLVEAGIESGLGVPIIVGGKLWGVMLALSTAEQPLPDGLERRLAVFSELVATAISNAEARNDLQRLAAQQAALRRVATLVAETTSPEEVFAAVATEVHGVLGFPTMLVRLHPDGSSTEVAESGGANPYPFGTTFPPHPGVIGMVRASGRPERVDDYADIPGEDAAFVRASGIRSSVGAPITVDGKTWGLAIVLSEEPLPAGTEARLLEFTELVATAVSNVQARDDLRDLAAEQAALRRVATLVAQGTDAATVFDAVCAETGELLGTASVNLAHFTPDGFNLTMAGWSQRDTHVPTGTRLPLSADTINAVIQRTVAPARFDSYEESAGELAALIRQRGIRSEVGAPVIVEGSVWGALIAGSDSDETLPSGAELRLARFAELTATAVSNATARSELIASRARIVAASDEARRRVERNLHDGTQQRLLAIGLDLQAARAGIPAELRDAQVDLERIEREIDAVLEDVRELSRGLHPPLLSQGGLTPSLRALARKSPIPVTMDVDVERRPSEAIEVAVYYVVSEALTNAAKHSQASEVSVAVRTIGASLHAIIEDDGRGGAEASAGSGLIGLVDRVEALGGRLMLQSPQGGGTRISIELPLSGPPTEVAQGVGGGERLGGAEAVPTTERALANATLVLAATEALADAVYIVDAQGRIRFLNPAALRILGYEDEGQLLGRPSHHTIHYLRHDGTPFPAAECPLLRPRVTGETVRVEEDWFVRQDGSLVPVAYSSSPVGLPDGRGAVVLFRDLSERPHATVGRV